MRDIKIGRGVDGKWYAGKTRILKNGAEVWSSKSDVTEYINAITEEKDKQISELKRQLAELPKKICDEIRESADVEVDEQGNVWIKTDSASLDDIQEKYEEGVKNEFV